MKRSLKHIPVISKKYFRASSPSVFGPYIIGIQSEKSEFIFCGGISLHSIYSGRSDSPHL